MAELVFHYIFKHGDGSKKDFSVRLDNETLQLIADPPNPAPEWTELAFNKCPNCPLAEAEHKHCPVALNISDLVKNFAGSVSHEKVNLKIETEARTYQKETTLQKGVSALTGIFMVTSGCPILDKLRPMVRMHLPFANLEETQYRALSMYLLAQYFLFKKGKTPDWELKNLSKIYENVHIVNKAFAKRLTAAAAQDALPNALVILNTFADSVSFALDKNALQKIERLFAAYLKESE